MAESWFGIESIPSIYGFFGAWLILSLFTYPYVYLNVSATLAGLDPSIEDAARGLGRGSLATFFTITLPMLRPSILAGMLLSALYTVSDFGVVTLLRYDSLTRAIYVQYRASFDRSYAAALSLVLIVFTLSLLFTEMKLRGSSRQARLGPGVARKAAQARSRLVAVSGARLCAARAWAVAGAADRGLGQLAGAGLAARR